MNKYMTLLAKKDILTWLVILLFFFPCSAKAAPGKKSVEWGEGSSAPNQFSVAAGCDAIAGGKSTVALGATAKADNWGDIALGMSAHAQLSGAISLGAYSTANNINSLAIGRNAVGEAAGGVALGAFSSSKMRTNIKLYIPTAANTAYINAINQTAAKDGWGEVSVGSDGNTRNIANVAAGIEDTDAVNIAQLKALDNVVTEVSKDVNLSVKYLKGAKNKLSVTDSGTAVKISNVANGDAASDAVNFSQLMTVSGDVAALGGQMASQDAKIEGLREGDDLSVKYLKSAKNKLSVTDSGTAVKISNVANGDAASDAVNFSQLKTVSNDLGMKINNIIKAGGADMLSVKYDDNTKSTITLVGGAPGSEVKLTNVANGDISKNSVDAISGKQMWTLADSMVQAMGGSFKLTTNGRINGTFNVNGKSFTSIQEAIKEAAASGAGQGSGSWTLSVNGKETNITNGGKFAIAEGSNLSITQDAHGTYTFGVAETPKFKEVKIGTIDISQGGINMGGSTITGLANGSVSQGSTDAVNGDQLWNAYRQIDTIDERVQIVGAHAAALSALHPVPYNPYQPTTLSAGLGMYRNEQSVAVGAFHYVRENMLVNAGLSINSNGDTMGRAGISFAIGQGGRKQVSILRDIESVQRQMAGMQQMLLELKKRDEEKDTMLKRSEEVINELIDAFTALSEKK